MVGSKEFVIQRRATARVLGTLASWKGMEDSMESAAYWLHVC